MVTFITKLVDSNGQIHHQSDNMVGICKEFYEKLYYAWLANMPQQYTR